jgi:hypothetical protein
MVQDTLGLLASKFSACLHRNARFIGICCLGVSIKKGKYISLPAQIPEVILFE